jgi:HEAT repeat protein
VSRSGRPWRRSKVERLRDRGDVRRLTSMLDEHDWVLDRDGVLVDFAVARRLAAVTALGTIDDPSAEDGLVRALADDDPRVRRGAVEALAPTPGAHAAKALAKAMAHWSTPDSESARLAALELLVGLADELNAVEYGQALVQRRHDEGLTAEERTAVSRLFAADSGPVAEIFARELVQRLAAREESDRRLVRETLIAMGRVCVGPLVSVLGDPGRRRAAASALGEIRDPQAVVPLIDVLSNGDPDVRPSAARALGAIRDPRALEALARASGDPSSDVRDAALEALDQMRGVIAMIGAAAFNLDNAGDEASSSAGADPTRARPLDTPRIPRSLLQRLLGH